MVARKKDATRHGNGSGTSYSIEEVQGREAHPVIAPVAPQQRPQQQ